ncbi:MAG TPA: MFS transporter [Acidimicrobiia bacterium]|jgi:MFS family permease
MTNRSTSLRPVVASFIVFGSFWGAWAVATVDVKDTFHLSDGGLGVLLAVGVSAAAGLNALGGVLSDRWGTSKALARALLVWGALLACQAFSPVLAVFAVAFVLATGAGGLVDVVMNVVSAAAYAAEPGKLVRFHGLFNLGALLGALLTGAVLEAGVSWRAAWVTMACCAIVIGVVTLGSRLPRAAPTGYQSLLRALGSLRHEGLALLATVFGASAMVEGGISTWGVLFLRSRLGVSVAGGVGAFVVGTALATITRIGGGPVFGRLGTRRAVLLGAGLAAAGLAVEALARQPVLAAGGLAAATVGISVVWPLLIADVNNEAIHPAIAIGGVTAAGYLGMVAGPPIVGFVSGAVGLRAGLLVLAATALFVAVTPARVKSRAVRTTAPEAGED